ncbi:MAG: 2-phospho-L-lactate guanylyltransferase [Acidobacteria bacterium]|nr:2-phospho-L-lactate guanylyltransferase [Acidobacteriota bacterium]
MIAALLPVKAFGRSKERLTSYLSPEEREQLARTMFDDVWTTLLEACSRGDGLDRLLVISSERYVLTRCDSAGVAYLEEKQQISHSASVRKGTEWAISLGATSLLSLPIDTPAATASEILAVGRLRDNFSVVVVPSADGTGTNALLRTPPNVINPHFGPGSCRLHVAEAHKRKLPVLVYAMSGFGADIDTPEDLQSFATTEIPCRTRELARQFLAVNRGATVCL